MRSLTKSSLDSMAALLPVLDDEEQRSIIGGTGTYAPPTGAITGEYTTTTTGAAFSFDTMLSMADGGTWMGGMVDGYGYVSSVEIVTGTRIYVTGAYDPNSNDIKPLKEAILLAGSRYGLDTQFERDCFENYWDSKGNMTLSEERFADIRKIADSQHPDTDVFEDNTVLINGELYVSKVVNFYGANADGSKNEYDYSLGAATVYFDTETGDPVGFFDVYDFDAKGDGKRGKEAENATRLVNMAGAFHGATSYKITFGQHE